MGRPSGSLLTSPKINEDVALTVTSTQLNAAGAGSHPQDTDTGTTSSSFIIDSGGTGFQISDNAGVMEVKDKAGASLANLKCNRVDAQILVHGTTEEIAIGDSKVILNADLTTTAANSDGGFILKRAAVNGKAVTATVAATSRIDCVGHSLTTGDLVFLSGTLKNDGQYEADDVGTDLDYFTIKAAPVFFGSLAAVVDETTPAGAKMTKGAPGALKMGTDGKSYVTDAVAAGAMGTFREVTTISGTQTLTNKTLTSPKLNEDVAVTATATELNVLDGITSTTAELNILDGVTSTAAELNVLDGISGNVTAANLNELTGAGATTLHSHAGTATTSGLKQHTAAGAEEYVDLDPDIADSLSEEVFIDGINYRKTNNYTVNYTGSGTGKTRITWVGFTLIAGELVDIHYTKTV